ncbi:MAG TPA: hypothetical protein DCX89_02650 [Saprospirales bacterium]|nr:hypothetical protein [Saprospirales bacterium]
MIRKVKIKHEKYFFCVIKCKIVSLHKNFLTVKKMQFKFTLFNVLILAVFTQISCGQKVIKLDPYLQAHSKQFEIMNHDNENDTLHLGHFDIYPDEFNTAWMRFAKIDRYFANGDIHKFSTSNNDNYVYNNLLMELNDRALLTEFARAYNMEIDIPDRFDRAFIAYFYASHDEYAIIFIQKNDNDIAGFASNKYEFYEIGPIKNYADSDKTEPKLPGYQIVLNRQVVGAYQRTGKPMFYMTNEYCDATEIIIAGIVGAINRINQL